jgi:predicted ArsR family transcriptional regulator
MLAIIGERQRQLLTLLLLNKGGMTVDEIAQSLEITRTAVNQHLAAMERDGYVHPVDLQKTAGRPGRVYGLTQRGNDLFPKQYSWFSSLMLKALKEELGSEGLARYLRKIAAGLASELLPRVQGKSDTERLSEIVLIMNELAYQARRLGEESTSESPRIEAKNCVYHDLARDHPEVCQFDLQLLAGLMGRDMTQVDHEECMVRGGQACRFRFRQESQKE